MQTRKVATARPGHSGGGGEGGMQGLCAAQQGRWLRSAGSLCGGHRGRRHAAGSQREAVTGPSSHRDRTKHRTRG